LGGELLDSFSGAWRLNNEGPFQVGCRGIIVTGPVIGLDEAEGGILGEAFGAVVLFDGEKVITKDIPGE
jgi:hypothetical protein